MTVREVQAGRPGTTELQRDASQAHQAADQPAGFDASAHPSARRIPFLLALLASFIVLSVITAVVLLVPGLVFVAIASEADLVINTVATLVAGAVAILAWIRFTETRQTDSLLGASAFLVLFAGNAIAQLVLLAGQGPALGFDRSDPGQAPIYLWTAQRLLAAPLLLIAALYAIASRHWPSSRSNRLAGLIVLGPATLLLAATALIVLSLDGLPTLIPQPILAALTTPLDRLDPALVTAPMLITQLTIAALYLAAGLGYGWAYERAHSRRPHYAYLSVGLVVAAFAQVHFAAVPGAYAGLITSGDVLRTSFYVVVFLGVAAAARRDLRDLREANTSLLQLRAADEERIALEERARLAREVHDGLVQDLWLARLTHGQLNQSLEGVPQLPADTHVLSQRMDAILEDALAEARQAVVSLQPQDDATFGSLLLRFVEDYADRFGLEVQCRVEGEPVLLGGQRQAEVLRICREALNNARKHADASLVRVSLRSDGESAVLIISDNGRGFALDKPPQRGGFGLKSMRERAAAVGGRLTVDSAEMDGTRVTLEIPGLEPGGAGG
jgi:signal transduction histidine kinase